MREMETQESNKILATETNADLDALGGQGGPPRMVNELRKAKLNAVKTLGAVCIAGGIPVEIQVIAAKTLLEFKLETIRENP